MDNHLKVAEAEFLIFIELLSLYYINMFF